MTVENRYFFNKSKGKNKSISSIIINIIVINFYARSKKRLMWKMKVILVSRKIKQNLNEYKQINVNIRI